MVNIRTLSYFYEVAKEESFTKAANNLHLSQPALSKVIKNLERELEVYLIDRTVKGFKLTHQGEIFFDNVRGTLERINLELEQLYATVCYKVGKLSIGIPHLIGTSYFSKSVLEFMNKYTKIEVSIVEEGNDYIKDYVEKSKIDFGIVILSPFMENLEIIRVIESELVFIANKNNRLAKRKKIQIEDLKNEDFVSLNKNYILRNILFSICESESFSPNIKFESSQWDFVLEMVELNQGIMLIPKSIVEKFKESNICCLPIKDERMNLKLAVVTKKDKDFCYSMKKFVNFIKEF